MNKKKTNLHSSPAKQRLRFNADGLIAALAKHPLLWAFAICLIINPLHFGEISNIPMNALYIELTVIIAAVFFAIHFFVNKNLLKRYEGAVFFVIIAAVCLAMSYLYSHTQAKALWILFGGCLLCVLLYFMTETKYREQLNCLFIIATSSLLKLYYVLCTSVYTRQHDVYSFDGDIGHAGYISYILKNYALPNVDVRNVWQYYHPPFHHTLSAIWIGFNQSVLGVERGQALESLQTLTLFYAVAIVIVSYKILRELKFRGAALYVPLAIVAFHPTFTFFAGSINNDPLSTLFMLGAILCTVKWYNSQKTSEIIKIAICIGLGMSTKLSAAIVAPSVAFVFLLAFFKNRRENTLGYVRQYAWFALVCIPLGMWFYIKNLIMYDVPITYVAELTKDNWLYIGDKSFLSRITDFSPRLFKNVFYSFKIYDWMGADAYNEYNPLIAILKNSLFTEVINVSNFTNMPSMIGVSTVFFWGATLLAAASFVFMIIVLCRKGMNPAHKLLFGSFYVISMLSFYKTAYDYPFSCTINFRYIAAIAVIGALFTGVFLQQLQNRPKTAAVRVLTYSIVSLTILFCILSFAVYAAAVFIKG